MTSYADPHQHPFIDRPNRTVLTLSVPIFFSLIAEPLTGLIDTGFIAALGSGALAALGVATTALSSVFWIFNFLGVGTQTEVANALGRNDRQAASELTSLALLMAAVLGLLLLAILLLFARPIAVAIGAEGNVLTQAVLYTRIRAWGSPALLLASVCFGALRGAQEMKVPMYITVAINAINIVLDIILIKGLGTIPAYGIAGAAAASVFAQWIGALAALWAVARLIGFRRQVAMRGFGRFVRIGRDMFIRTSLLTLFLLLSTRLATRSGADSGAAHQAIRQIWLFTALGLDAVAATAQSLVGYFLGAGWQAQARRVAAYCCLWGLVLGVLLAAGMWAGTAAIANWLVPTDALVIFGTAWPLAMLTQPGNALAFVTDGIHHGAGDFKYLRNVLFVSTTIGVILLYAVVRVDSADALRRIWIVTAVWIVVRAGLGVARVWPGIGRSPFADDLTQPKEKI